jgi:hypothetical protein
LVPIACRSVSCQVMPPCLPLVASLTASVGDLAVVTLRSPWPVVVLVESPALEAHEASVPGMLGAGGMP